jgi:WD40 repeat protein
VSLADGLFAVQSDRRLIKVYSTKTDDCLEFTPEIGESFSQFFQLQDGRLLAQVYNHGICIWNISNDSDFKYFPLSDSIPQCDTIYQLTKDQLILCQSFPGKVILWNVNSGISEKEVCFEGSISQPYLLSSGFLIVLRTQEKCAELIPMRADVSPDQLLGVSNISRMTQSGYEELKFHEMLDGRVVVAGFVTTYHDVVEQVAVWDPRTGAWSESPVAETEPWSMSSVQCPDNRFLLMDDEIILVFNADDLSHPLELSNDLPFRDSRRKLKEYARQYDERRRNCVMSVDIVRSPAAAVVGGAAWRVLTTSYDRRFRLWNPMTGECDRIIAGHGSSCLSLPCGRLLGISSWVSVSVWEPIAEEDDRSK